MFTRRSRLRLMTHGLAMCLGITACGFLINLAKVLDVKPMLGPLPLTIINGIVFVGVAIWLLRTKSE